MNIFELDTPSVVIDLERMEKNISNMQRYCVDHGVEFRPHIKTHKSPMIAQMQLAAGAVGITCQKLGEAEVMVENGVRDVLIYYNIMGSAKLERLGDLASKARVSLAVDSEFVIRGIAEMCAAKACNVGIFIDCDTGLHRTGVSTPEEALRLATIVENSEYVEFMGLTTYPLSENSRPWMSRVQELFSNAGMDSPYISGGGTDGARDVEKVPQVSALCAGTYVFYDWSSVSTGLCSPDDCAASLITTVVSEPHEKWVTVDAGSKSLSSDYGYMEQGDQGFGHVVNYPEARIFSLSEEHGQIDFSQCVRTPVLGERLRIIPNHVCAMINLHDEVYGFRQGDVDLTWPVIARGKTR